MGDTNQFIPRTIASIRDNLKALNVEAELVTAYPSEFENILKDRQFNNSQ